MSNREPSRDETRWVVPSDKGVFHDLALRIKLVIRLLADPRISVWLKLLPFGSLVYLLFPDLAPGPIDDAAIIGLGIYLFIELCPPEIVQEHMETLTNVIPGEWRDLEDLEGDIIDADFTEKD